MEGMGGPIGCAPSAQRLSWAQRHNPAWLALPTFVAAFRRSSMDATARERTDDNWTAEVGYPELRVAASRLR